MNKTNLHDMPVVNLTEDLLAYAAGYLELVVAFHDGLVARIEECNGSNIARVAEADRLQRQLQIQAAVVESATQIVAEIVSCDKVRGPACDQAEVNDHRLQLLDEIRGLADLSVPA